MALYVGGGRVADACLSQAHQWEDAVRFLIYPAAAVTLATVFLIVPAQATHYLTHFYAHHGRLGTGSDGFGRPYWQGEPMDRLPIWRYGYYQGNDPDQFIRSQMMRDPVYGPWH
jgi:hypothetical protein